MDVETIKSYARDLKSLLEEADIMESKAFLRSFIKRIDIDGSQGVIHYNLPVPPHGEDTQLVGVLPIDSFGGDRGIRTPDLCDANAALSLLSYIPVFTILTTTKASFIARCL